MFWNTLVNVWRVVKKAVSKSESLQNSWFKNCFFSSFFLSVMHFEEPQYCKNVVFGFNCRLYVETQFKIWHDVNSLIQNLTGCEKVYSKPDFLRNFRFKNMIFFSKTSLSETSSPRERDNPNFEFFPPEIDPKTDLLKAKFSSKFVFFFKKK